MFVHCVHGGERCRSDDELKPTAISAFSDTVTPIFVACRCGLAREANELIAAVQQHYHHRQPVDLPAQANPAAHAGARSDQQQPPGVDANGGHEANTAVWPLRHVDGSTVEDPPLPPPVEMAAQSVHSRMNSLAIR